ncbi:MAG TPA: hypothetical protein VEY68_04725 [Anoxybacillus sp.]|jgi:hypothetical protein|nr:hypothetical protein [Anoxybacillus sp.]
MSKIYTDYMNRIALTIPDRFIDVKTGESYSVSPKIQEQIEYHTKNNTLIHLIFSALNSYLNTRTAQRVPDEILSELAEIKKMLEQGYIPAQHSSISLPSKEKSAPKDLDIREVEDILEAFGG